MSLFNFQIDKKTCFIKWVESLIDWDISFRLEKYEYFSKIGGSLQKKELRALEQLKTILQKKNNGFLWLWRRYGGEKIKNKKEYAIWENIQSVLRDKFEKTWKNELSGLHLWKNTLTEYDFGKADKTINKIAHFFRVEKIPDNIVVKLVFHWDEKYLNGATIREFDDILLGISHLKKQYLSRAIGTLMHEFIHKIENMSLISNHLTRNSYTKIIMPYKIPTPDRQWRHLFTESIITSMAGFPYDDNYIQKKIFKRSDKTITYNQNINHYRVQIRIVAQRLINITAEYLDKDKVMDKQFCDIVANEWLKLKQKTP